MAKDRAAEPEPQLPLFQGAATGRRRRTAGADRPDGGAARPEPRRSDQPTAEEPTPKEPSADPEVLTVAGLDRRLKRLLEGATAHLRVRGEISGLHRAGSGHAYFTLKDEREDALIDCVMYRSAPARARRLLADGETVVLSGRVTVYAPRGRMQLVADDVLGSARGALLERLEKLKAKLAAEGLFDADRKQLLPTDPRCIAVLTSRDGAAIHDVVRVAFRRGRVRILLVPTPVQGAGAAERIARAITATDQLRSVDAMIVTRGGGSAEDLAAYNDEVVVRAIASASLPVVSAVGHEVDVSLSDLAADRRAATPSQAAELIVPDYAERGATLNHLSTRLSRSLHHRLSRAREGLTRLRSRLGEPRRLVLEQSQRFDDLSARLERAMTRQLGHRRSALHRLGRGLEAQHPRRVLGAARLRLSPLEPKLHAAMQSRLRALHHRLAGRAARLDAMSPLSVLGRGYAIATSETGKVVRDAREVAAGDELTVRLHRGRLRAQVVESRSEPPTDAKQEHKG
ncbi:MAG: exodeoxyribonuclease VII large subunit [Deltaproteobacteria bacterium]|nr:exodeoxyribonuclease VII large subunit [Deltaproteobacteria bacterium]